ncbi:MAG TPA: ribonuclease J [Bacilli bacterium]|nr:ribonuclease J [Bacilli bacterium]
MENKLDTKVFALGGLGEVGKNMYCIMHNNELIIIDCGVMFPKDELLGIDYVIPDYSFLKKNEDKIKALFITHGHEDHIGGIPFLLSTVKIPVIYAPDQACGLIKKKLERKALRYDNLVTYKEDDVFKFKNFTVEFVSTTHSVPSSYLIVISTPNGKIVHTGDYKFDLTPIGPVANIHKMAEIGKNGIKLLLSESTNALSEGFSKSESKVDEALGEMFANRKVGRIIVVTFASNIYRLKHIIETCKVNNRKVVLFGNSMENNIEIAIQGGFIDNSDNILIDQNDVNKYKDEELCLLCTGSQGEALAALSRIAKGTHRQIKIKPNDMVIFSSNPIPGNSASVAKTINALYLQGVDVYTTSLLSDIHASGHGYQEELKLMIRLFKPEYFVPIHGEYRMMKIHRDLAIDCGISKDKIFLLENGDVISLGSDGIIKKDGNVGAKDVYVDGNRIGDIGSSVIRDRKVLANDGILVAVYNVDVNNNTLIGRVNIITRGFILVNENDALIKQIESYVTNIINTSLSNKEFNIKDLKNQIIADLLTYIYNETGRKPVILPVMLEINKK